MLICFVLIYSVYGVYYLSNDDTGIMKTFSGYNTGIPTAYHQYASYTLGMIYKLLYTIVPMWNWYSYGLIFVVIISNSVIIYLIWRQRSFQNVFFQFLDLLLIGLITAAISMCGIIAISWTITAVFATVAGIMLLLDMNDRRTDTHRIYGCAVVFFAVGALIRNSSYKAVLPFALLVLFYWTGNRICKEGKTKLKRICIESIIYIIPLLGILAYDHIDVKMKSEEVLSNVDDFEYYRGLYTDSRHLPYVGNEEFYESIGWDQELYIMTETWMFIDPRFNMVNLKKIAEASSSLNVEKNLSENAQTIWDDFVIQTSGNYVRIGMSITVIACLLVSIVLTVYKLLHRKNWYDWLFLAGLQMLTIAEWIYLLCERGRFIDRTFYCATLPALFIGMWVIARHVGIMDKHKIVYFVVTICTVLSIYISVNQNIRQRIAGIEKYIQISHDADEIYFNHPNNLYIYDNSIISGTSLFLDMRLRGCGNNALMWGGTGVYSKLFYEIIDQFGYDKFYSDNLFDDNVYYVTTDSNVWESAFMQYMKKAYGDSVTADVEEITGSGVYVYKFSRE